MIRCNLSSVTVLDQQKAEDFYVGRLGFVKKHDVPAGAARWLTVEAADGSGVELLLEPAGLLSSSHLWARLRLVLLDASLPEQPAAALGPLETVIVGLQALGLSPLLWAWLRLVDLARPPPKQLAAAPGLPALLVQGLVLFHLLR